MQVITRILPGSIAEELNIRPGSKLLTVNGEEVTDIFDYQFLIADEYVELAVENPSGEVDTYPIEKDYDEEMGLVFENSLMDDYRSCCNRCIFCFIDQMPPGMRETLYFKDDDSRLSFLQGNYITLTNMKEADIHRIIRYHMQPINISVHTTNPDLRCEMLRNKNAGKVLRYLDILYEAGITMNAQIVLCKGVNDRKELERTIRELAAYAPVLESVSVVPVGLTRFREGLYPLEPLEKRDAEDVIDTVERFQEELYSRFGIHFIHASDELYLLAERPVPEAERYDGYLQLENGVGMLRLLEEEFREALEELCAQPDLIRRLQEDVCTHTDRRPQERTCRTIATGKLAYPLICRLVRTGMERIREAILHAGTGADPEALLPQIRIRAIENHFFGERITVSGLVCGCDILEQLREEETGREILLPVNMMRAGERYFLDDVTIEDLERTLGVRAVIVPSDGESLLKAMLGEPIQTGRRQIYEQADRSDRR